MLRRLPSDEGAARRAATGRDARDQFGDLVRIELTDGHIIQEGQRLRAGAHDVVGAHRDKVDADRVEPADRPGDGGLRADAVSRGDQHRLAVAGRDGKGATEAAESADDLRSPGRFDVRAHQLHGTLAGRDINA